MANSLFSKFPKLPKGVWTLGFTSLFTDIAGEIVYPLLPLFLANVLGAGALSLGLIEGVAESTASLFKFLSGWWSDRVQRNKVFVLIGYGVANLMKPVIGLATAWPQVLVIRFIDRVGKGIRTAPRDAWLSNLSTPETYPKVYGFHRGMDHLGAVLGPLLAGLFLFFHPGNYRTLFLLTLIPGVLSIAMVLLTHEERKKPQPKSENKPLDPIHSWKSLSPTLKEYFVILFLFALGNSADAFLILRLKEGHVLEASIPIWWAVLHIIKMGSSFLSSAFVDKYGIKSSLLTGWVLYTVTYLSFAIITNSTLLVAVFCIYGLFFGLTEAPEKVLVASLSSKETRGTAFGMYAMVLGLAALPASVIFGVLWKYQGMQTAFYFGAVLAFVSSLLLMRLPIPRMHQRLGEP